jgi:hypothetical protein
MADELVFPHELRIGDLVEMAGGQWRVTRPPRRRLGSKSIEIALEHVKHRGETLVWPFDEHRRVKRVSEG